MIDTDKYMKLVEGIARTANERTFWYGLVGEMANLYERVKELESKQTVSMGPASANKPPTPKVVKKKPPTRKKGE